MTRFVVIQTGDAAQAVADRAGNYDQMFLDHLNGEGHAIAVHRNEPLPRQWEVDAVLITGSPFSVYERQPWEQRLEAWTREVVQAQKPLLGVCYGHQLVAQALGGEVKKNPRGYEIGTVDIELTQAGKEDPLLSPLVPLRFSAVHGDAVTRMPEGAKLLAENARCAVQAFALGPMQWCVQFHPEFSSEVTAMYVEARADTIRKDAAQRGEDPEAAVQSAQASIRPAPAGPALMARFVELVSKESK